MMSVIDLYERYEDLQERKIDGSNPYMSADMNKLMCKLNIDPAGVVRVCDAVGNFLLLLSDNKRQPSLDFQHS